MAARVRYLYICQNWDISKSREFDTLAEGGGTGSKPGGWR
jgi:hypothetical protein